MGDVLTNNQIAREIVSIEGDLSVIMQFMRQLAEEGFAVEPKGVAVMEGMVFTTSLRLAQLRGSVIERLADLQTLADEAGWFFKAVEADDAKTREMVALLRRAAMFLHSPSDRKEADDALRMIRQGLSAIEQRTLGGETPSVPDNVVELFPQPAEMTMAPEGGAA